MTKELDEFGNEHPSEERSHGQPMRIRIPILRGLVAEVDKGQIAEERRRRQGREMHRIGAVGLTPRVDP